MMNEQINGYTDIHTHILPGVDDGSRNLEQTLHMLHLAHQENITTIIATPHYFAGEENASVDQLYTLRDKVQKEATKLNSDMKILLGNELYYSEGIVDALKSKKALTLAESRYVLVEFSVRVLYEIIYRGLGELIRAGYIPILAHVERYHCLDRRDDLIRELIKSGSYIQLNSNSLSGGLFDARAAFNRKLVNMGYIHFIASDCHDDKIRIPNMLSVVGKLQKKCDESILDQIFMRNPLHILENTYL